MAKLRRTCGSGLGILLTVAVAAAHGGDWPQVLGPQRNGHAAPDERLHDSWPADGPAVVWQQPVGSGYAGIAVAGGRAVVFDRTGDRERVTALDAATGQRLWQDGHPSTFAPQVGGADGPLCTPTIHAGKVITLGAQGVLSCHDLASGKRIWTRPTHEEFGALEGYFGAGSSPLVEGDIVIVNVGGKRSQAGVVAVALGDGATKWTAVSDDASYSSPIVATLDGQRRVLLLTRLKCIALDPATGEVQFEFPFGLRGPTVNAATPLLIDGKRLFLTASYGIGALLTEISSDSARTVWQDDELLSSQYATPVFAGGALYGFHGRQDGPQADLRCVDPIGRRTLWEQAAFGYGNLIVADDKLLIAGSEGTLTLARANSRRYEPLASAQIHDGEVRAIPALSGGRLYLRDDDTLKCLAVGATGKAISPP